MTDVERPERSRREVLALFGGVGAVLIAAGCSSGGSSRAAKSSTSTTTTAAAATGTAVASCALIPDETAGPFPGDGTSGPNVLAEDGVVRRDIRSSFGSASGVAEGVPLGIDLTIVDSRGGCRALPGAAVYVWHCDRDGQYSRYGDGLEDENYLRGVQVADANGALSFTSIFPAAYSGRWPHIHFEVFESLARATNGANKIAVSQLALPGDVCTTVYATDGYEQSARTLEQSSIKTDNVFSDGVSLQMPTITGDVSSGYRAALVVGV